MLLVLFFATFSINNLFAADLLNPHGFQLGTKQKEVEKELKSIDVKILEKEKQSKDMSRIIFEGALVKLPIEDTYHKETRLEFFKKKLMASSLFFKFIELESG